MLLWMGEGSGNTSLMCDIWINVVSGRTREERWLVQRFLVIFTASEWIASEASVGAVGEGPLAEDGVANKGLWNLRHRAQIVLWVGQGAFQESWVGKQHGWHSMAPAFKGTLWLLGGDYRWGTWTQGIQSRMGTCNHPDKRWWQVGPACAGVSSGWGLGTFVK